MGDQITFTGLQVDNATAISQWDWVIRNDRFSGQTTSQRFVRPGTYPILLKAQATNGCISTTDSTSLTINQAIAHAGNDTIAAIGIPFTLQGGGNGRFQWLPMGVVSNDTMAHANFIPLDDQQLILLVTTPEGCFASDTVFIRAIKGPEIYVPDAFTPNGDGLNDVFRPIAVGFKSLRRFSIYNRWGQLVFETRNSSFGWNGGSSATGTYVWVVEAITEKNQNIIRKGTVTLIR
jgi:gliding motility-associated-like protein